MMRSREISPVGKALRVVAGLFLLYYVSLGGGSWDLAWYEAGLGLVAFPVLMIGVGLVVKRVHGDPVRFTGIAGHLANLAIIVVLVANPYTASGATLFYGATMLVAAWRGQRGCEGTVISNIVLRRDDQIGCPLFAPFDELEDHLRQRDRSQTTPAVELRPDER